MIRAVVSVGWVRARIGIDVYEPACSAAPARSSSWKRIASATIAASSSGTTVSVVFWSEPPASMHAYSGRSWNSAGRLRARSVRSKPIGPIPLRIPLTSETSAFNAPRCGVPSVMTFPVTS